MKKAKLIRYDLDRVYYLNEYKKAKSHAEQNIGIDGIKEQLDSLIVEKKRYSKEVSTLVEAERDNERQKYEKYEKWATIAKVSRWVLLGSAVIIALLLAVPNALYRALSFFFGTVVPLAFLVSCPTAIVSFFVEKVYRQQYQKYVDGLSAQIDSLGKTFTQTSKNYYHAIDSLYLNSLDATQRELVLMRREQAAQSQQLLQAEKERQHLQKQLLREQKRTRKTQEELLAIEKEREARYKSRW